MKYIDQRQSGVPCMHKECRYYNNTYEQHCEGEIGGGPAVEICTEYTPANIQQQVQADPTDSLT